MKRLPLLLSSCLAAILAAPGHADNIDDYIRAQMRAQHIPGLSLAIVRGGKIIRARGYGFANLELSVPATPKTRYEIGSITKQFTATAIMMLVEEDKIALDNPIGKYIEGCPPAWDKVTVRRLLTHTSGIKSYTSLADFATRTVLPTTEEGLVKLVAGYPLDFPPGDSWSYDNSGFYLLGMIVEKASGMSYAAFLKQRIFDPLHMDSTQMNDLSDVITNRASGYDWGGDSYRNAAVISMTWPFAAGALVSTVTDMAKWDAALYTDKLLKPTSLQQMWTPVTLNNGKTEGYGFGWFVGKFRGHRQVSHAGGIPGFVTQETRLMDDKLTIIVFTNCDNCDPGGIANAIARMSVPAWAHAYHHGQGAEPAVLAKYAGRYEVENNAMLTLRTAGGNLTAQVRNGPIYALVPASPTAYYNEAEGVAVDIGPGDGPITTLTIHQDDSSRTIPRLGPLPSTLQPQPDPDPAATEHALQALQAIGAGGAPMAECKLITGGLRKDLSGGAMTDVTGMESLQYLGDSDVTSRGVTRHGGTVARIRFYRASSRPPKARYVQVYFTAEGLVTDEDSADD